MLDLTATVNDDGHLPAEYRQALARFLASRKGQRVRVRLSKPIRSTRQNSYYWGVIVPAVRDLFISHGTACTADDVHEFLKVRVYGLQKNLTDPATGQVTTIAGDSSKLLTDEFEQYAEACRAWAADQGVLIPLPREELIT